MPLPLTKDSSQRVKASEADETSVSSSTKPRSHLRGLWLVEWQTHNRLLLGLLATWLLCVWMLPLFAHPGWLLLLGGVYALIAGAAFGGTDALDGVEEFFLSLPVTRRERYQARLFLGTVSLIILTAMNLIALGLDLPQALASLYVDAGLIAPAPILKPRLLYGLVLALPLAAFAFTFALAANATSRTHVLGSWFWGGLAALAILRGGLLYERWYWDEWNGYVVCPLLLLAAAVAAWSGHRAYAEKEIAQAAAPIVLPGRWWLWVLLAIAGICLALLLVSSLMKEFGKLLATA